MSLCWNTTTCLAYHTSHSVLEIKTCFCCVGFATELVELRSEWESRIRRKRLQKMLVSFLNYFFVELFFCKKNTS